MGDNEKYFNAAVVLVVMSGALLWFGKGGLSVQQVFVLFLLLVFATLFPLWGLVLLIPITLVLWFRHYSSFFNWIGALGGTKINRA